MTVGLDGDQTHTHVHVERALYLAAAVGYLELFSTHTFYPCMRERSLFLLAPFSHVADDDALIR